MQLVEQVQAGLTRRQILVMRKPGDILQRSRLPTLERGIYSGSKAICIGIGQSNGTIN